MYPLFDKFYIMNYVHDIMSLCIIFENPFVIVKLKMIDFVSDLTILINIIMACNNNHNNII